MSLELSMVGLVVRDMAASQEFYRRLGVDIPESADAERFVMHRMESGVTLFWDTVFAKTYDPARDAPGGYRIMLEFHGRTAPLQTSGPYAAMVDDPDGNMILITAG